jgi:hypothetical protein
VALAGALATSCTSTTRSEPEAQSTTPMEQARSPILLVLAAPSIDNPYYQPAFQEIVNFQVKAEASGV